MNKKQVTKVKFASLGSWSRITSVLNFRLTCAKQCGCMQEKATAVIYNKSIQQQPNEWNNCVCFSQIEREEHIKQCQEAVWH